MSAPSGRTAHNRSVMALGNLTPPPENPYRMLDAGMALYDCQPGAAACIPQFFTAAPMPSPAYLHYRAPVSYGGYHSYDGLPRVLPGEPAAVGRTQWLDGLPHVGRSRSPSIKIEAEPPTPEPLPPVSRKVIVPNVRVHGAPVYQFNTAIDRLTRVIEAKRGIVVPLVKEESEPPDEGSGGVKVRQGSEEPAPTFLCCDIPGCSKVFVGKGRLDIHRRAHTGESPYVCSVCLRRFTQKTNLKSHVRRHLGETPYKCPQCPKAFPQASNIKAHMKTHQREELRERWVCRVGNCERSFSTKGNLKGHQNKQHAAAIDAFKAKLDAIEDKNMISKEDKEMARYIADVHSLSNKGIKGRGIGCKVRRLLPHPVQTNLIDPVSAPTNANAYQMPLPSYGLPTLRATPQQLAPPVTHVYGDQHGRGMAFGEWVHGSGVTTPPSEWRGDVRWFPGF